MTSEKPVSSIKLYIITEKHLYIFHFSSQAKKAREQAALKNAQSLFDELDAEKEKKEIKKKAAARRRSRRKERKRKEQQEKAAVRRTSQPGGAVDYERRRPSRRKKKWIPLCADIYLALNPQNLDVASITLNTNP